jgi:predicted metal-binding membrane protein
MRRRVELWLVLLTVANAAAWLWLAQAEGGLMMPAICMVGMPRSSLDSLALVLSINSPARLALGWLLMVTAMMLPMIIAPLQHLRERSFARRRDRATLIFVLGYLAVWMAAGMVLQVAAIMALGILATSLQVFCFGGAIALVWQLSPVKQWSLNRCHRRPALAAFGLAADRDAFTFGVANGVACAGACWTLMLLILLVPSGHGWAMLLVGLFAFAERLESPAPLSWRWRGCGKALRIVVQWGAWPGAWIKV